MRALCTDYSESPFRQPLLFPLISSMSQELSIFAKRFSQRLSVHREKPQTEGIRHKRGINERPRAIPLCVRKGSRCSTCSPRGSRPWNFISGRGRPNLLHRGGLGDGRGKSSLLWIVIIGLLTNPLPLPSHKKCARACVGK